MEAADWLGAAQKKDQDQRLSVMSQFSFVSVSDVVQDGVGSVKPLAQRRLHSAPPALQLRPALQDVPASTQRLWGGEPISGRRSSEGQ